MPNLNQINQEIDANGNNAKPTIDKYITALESNVGAPVIAYYSGFLTNPNQNTIINDLDMNGFMAVIHGMDRSKGLYLMLHTPGGGIEITNMLVHYLYSMFGKNIICVVPQIAMSAGTMIACACKTILMAKHSCLGPTDPQMSGFPAIGVISEVDRAIVEIKADRAKRFLWQEIFKRYPPAFLSDCERAVEGTKSSISGWLEGCMFAGDPNPADRANLVVERLMDYSGIMSHAHRFNRDDCRRIGLTVNNIETDGKLQEDILSVHHSVMSALIRTNRSKIIYGSNTQSWLF